MSAVEVRPKLTIQEELEIIRQQNGGTIPPKAMVNFARDPETTLHSKFEWDDSVGGEQYRLWQARVLIKVFVKYEPKNSEANKPQTVSVDVAKVTPKSRPIPGVVSLISDRTAGRGYRLTEDVMADPVLRAELLEQAKRELRRVRDKYELFVELAEVFVAIDQVLEE